MRTLLIDGDTLLFEAAAAHEYEVQWEEWLWTLHGKFVDAKEHLVEAVNHIIEGLGADKTIIALSDTQRWRPSVMPEYKSNRRKTRKPITYQPLREFCHETWETFQRPMLEGDDVLGILATHPHLIPGEKIVVSIDKDMNTIPGLHLNYSHAREQQNYEACLRTISVEEADRYHMLQTLTGDRTDGYPGCPGVGPVNAEKILDASKGNVWGAVVAAYAKKGLGEEVALQNARVARICRHTEYDFTKKEVVLWTPTQA